MIKLKKIIICTALLAALSAPASADQVAYTTADMLNVRSQPDVTSQVVAQYPNGSTVNVTDLKDVWYQIRFNEGFAYVHSDYVKFNPVETPVTSKGQEVVNKAEQYLGVPYVYGGMSPSGFDCSGLVKYVYGQMGVSLNRVAADQTNNGYEVSLDEIQPGDILFFYSSAGSGYIGHVGIYAGYNQFVHAPRTGLNVKLEYLSGSYANRLACARRVF